MNHRSEAAEEADRVLTDRDRHDHITRHKGRDLERLQSLSNEGKSSGMQHIIAMPIAHRDATEPLIKVQDTLLA